MKKFSLLFFIIFLVNSFSVSMPAKYTVKYGYRYQLKNGDRFWGFLIFNVKSVSGLEMSNVLSFLEEKGNKKYGTNFSKIVFSHHSIETNK